MKLLISKAVMLASVLSLAAISQGASPDDPNQTPQYSGDQLLRPDAYREWIFLSSGYDMSYSAVAKGEHHVFDNVFVQPTSYAAFLRTGTWPENTVLVLEVRDARGNGSINRHGNFQGVRVMGLEVHVKDRARFAGGWAFFSFDNHAKRASMIPTRQDCYACHLSHGAVDTTFVQFYPTLLPVAQVKRTLSPNYKP